jgi:hypothetical protein
VTDPRPIDRERLAALLDGRLGPADADAVRAELAAADDDTLGAYADAIAIAAQDESARDVAPGGTTRARRWWALSASAAIVLLLAVMVMRAPRLGTRAETTSVLEPTTLAAALDARATVPTSTAWGSMRGTEPPVAGTRERAARVGALLTDFALAVQRHDSAANSIASSLGALIGEVAGGRSVAEELGQFASGPARARTPVHAHDVSNRALGMVDEKVARPAAWIEAARLASSAGDATFLARFPAEGALASLAGDTSLDATTRATVKRVLVETRRSHVDSAALNAGLDELLRRLAQ